VANFDSDDPRRVNMATRSSTAGAGSVAPDFTLVDQHGVSFRLSDVYPEGPVVLVFLRGFS
jgi:peroxiredoxin